MSTVSKISCQISFYPLGETNYNDPINEVINLVKDTNISAEVNDMATILRGNSSDIFALLQQITAVMSDKGISYVMTTTISNTCGCSL